MFGKPEWFCENRRWWKLSPVSWRGKVYALAWAAVVLLPLAGLLGAARVPEACIWLAVSFGALVWDVRQIRAQLRSRTAAGQVLYIDDEEQGEPVQTPNYDLQLRA